LDSNAPARDVRRTSSAACANVSVRLSVALETVLLLLLQVRDVRRTWMNAYHNRAITTGRVMTLSTPTRAHVSVDTSATTALSSVCTVYTLHAACLSHLSQH